MHAATAQRRLQCVREIATALELSPGEPVAADLLSLLKLAADDLVLAALVAIVRERPSYLIIAKENPAIVKTLRKINMPWPRFAELIPRVVAAAEEIHECCRA
jgi:hypothetical protein